jgi:hypothetical protein
MKKILGFVAALLLALSLPMTVFAQESPTGSIEIDWTLSEVDGVKKGMSSDDVNKIWGTNLASGYTVILCGDAYKVGNPADEYTQEFTTSADIVVHKGKAGLEILGGTFTLKAGNLSPVIQLKKDTSDNKTTPSKDSDGGKKATNTADSSNMFVYGGLLVVALGAIAAVVTAKKRNA